jgi:hypothetical protein
MLHSIHRRMPKNIHAIMAWMRTIEPVSPMNPRVELRQLLLEQRRTIDRLLEHVEDPSASPVRLVELIEAMEQLDDRKAPLIRILREEASETRRREEERSVRQFVLRALEFVGAPQSAGFLQEFIWARDRVDLNTRGFGALRRDEARAWRRGPGRRVAYIVPALNPDGRPLARWMARSDWPMPQRIVVEGAEHLFGVKRLDSLFRAREELPITEVSDPYVSLIRHYAPEVLEIEQPPIRSDGEEAAWLAAVRRSVQEEMARLENAVSQAQRQVLHRLATLTEEEQLWGR